MMTNKLGGMHLIEQNLRDQGALQEKADELRTEFVNRFTPVRPGDVVTVTGYAHAGYAHAGKSIRVQSIQLRQSFDGRWWFEARGPVLRKDGSTGIARGTAVYDLDGAPRKAGAV